MIQEYVPGEIRDVCVLFNQGEPRAALAQRRVWTWPPGGGPGILNETIKDPQLINYALKLLKRMNWHGVAQVEFKLDAEGKPRLMEVNPKFWGTLELSIAAGIDFPYLLYKMAVDGDADAVFDYKDKLSFAWLFPMDVHYIASSPYPHRDALYLLKLIFAKGATTDILFKDSRPEAIKLLMTAYRVLKKRNAFNAQFI